MDKAYRKALKQHLMKAFEINKMERKEKQKSTSPDLVQALFPTPSLVSKSRIIDALIDTPMQTARESHINMCCHQQEKTKVSPKNNQSQRKSTTTPTTRRMKGGDNTNVGCGDGPNNSQTNFSVYTFDSTNQSLRSRTPSFRKRTARELSNMVIAECNLVESLNLVETARSQQCKVVEQQQQQQQELDLPIVLWRTKRKKFNSSVDLRFDDHTPPDSCRYQKSVPPPPSTHRSSINNDKQQQQQESEHDEDEYLDAEGIIREQFTGPLIRHVERNYVRNITATADLLKLLERMPADIDRVLARECNK